MARLAFTFSYHSFASYIRNNCDSEQEVDGTLVDEKWLYRNMEEYLSRQAAHLYDLHFESFIPEEFKTGDPGAPRRVDLVGYGRRKTAEQTLAILMEAKLMVQDNRQWAREIFTDILRVACVKQQTTRKTQRYVLVAGQKRCWEQAERQLDNLLFAVCPKEPQRDPKTLFLTRKRQTLAFTPSWKQDHPNLVDEYLLPLLPSKIQVELTAYSPSSRAPHEQPEAGITARLWRVYPK